MPGLLRILFQRPVDLDPVAVDECGVVAGSLAEDADPKFRDGGKPKPGADA